MPASDLPNLERRVSKFAARRRATPKESRVRSWNLYLEGRALIDQLERAMAPGDPEVTRFATEALRVLKADLERLVQGDGFNRIAVELCDKSERDLAALRRHLESPEDRVRFDAVSACALLEFTAAAGVLIEHLAVEEHPFVLSLMTKTIGRLGGVPALEPLKPFLRHADDRVRANAVEGLEAVPGDEKFAALMPLLEDPSSRVRANVLKAVKDLGLEAFQQLVSRMVESPRSDFRQSALYVLKGLKSSFARDCLLELLQDQRMDIRSQAMALLVLRPDAQVWAALVELAGAATSDEGLKTVLALLAVAKRAAPPELSPEIDGLVQEAVLRDRQRKEAALLAAAAAAAAAAATPDEPDEPDEPDDERDEPDERDDQGEDDEGEPPGESDADAAAASDAEAVKKVLARMNAALSALAPRERRAVENQIKLGKVINESQLARVVKRMRDKQRK